MYAKWKYEEQGESLGSGSKAFANLCMGSLKVLFTRYQESHGAATFKLFAALGKTFSDIKPSDGMIREVFNASVEYALEDVSERLEFLEGLHSFIPVLSRAGAEGFVHSLKCVELGQGMEGMEDAWEPYFTFKGKIEARASGAERTTRGRKISFAGMDGDDNGAASASEEDDDGAASASEEDDEPGPSGAQGDRAAVESPSPSGGVSAMEDISNGKGKRPSPLKRKMRDRRKSDQVMQQVEDDAGGEEEPRILRRRRRPL